MWNGKILMNGVSAWLSTFGMSVYEHSFRCNGYDDLMVIEELNEKVRVTN